MSIDKLSYICICGGGGGPMVSVVAVVGQEASLAKQFTPFLGL